MYEAFQYIMGGTIAVSLVAFLYLTWKSPRRGLIITRFWNDAYVFWKDIWIFLFAIFMLYFQGVVGRTLAFYMHHQLSDYVKNPDENLKQTRLYDIGHELFPDMSGNETITIINEALQYLMFGCLAAMFSYPYWTLLRSGRSVPVYTLNMLVRFFIAFSSTHMLRMFCYLGTSLPGPSEHCIGEIADKNKPTSLTNIFWKPKVGANCGDLIFSGHMLTATSILLTIQLYVEKMRGLKVSLIALAAVTPLYIWQIINILLARAHYTVDLVVAIETTIFYFTALHRVWWVNDAAPRWNAEFSTEGLVIFNCTDPAMDFKEDYSDGGEQGADAVVIPVTSPSRRDASEDEPADRALHDERIRIE